MGWVDEQIKQRKENDDKVFSDSFINVAGAVMGTKISAALNDNKIITKNAIDDILKYYQTHGLKAVTVSQNLQKEG